MDSVTLSTRGMEALSITTTDLEFVPSKGYRMDTRFQSMKFPNVRIDIHIFNSHVGIMAIDYICFP